MWKTYLATGVVRKFILPGIIGFLVVWLTNHHFGYIADAICIVADGIGIQVNECKELN